MMVSTLTFTLVYASVLSVIAAGAAVYWSMLNVRRLRVRQAALEMDNSRALKELEVLTAIVGRIEETAECADRNASALAERMAALELRGESRLYGQAIDSARSGADPSKLARTFGLTSTEANLLRLVHGGRAGSA